jgi:hypothetical protein
VGVVENVVQFSMGVTQIDLFGSLFFFSKCCFLIIETEILSLKEKPVLRLTNNFNLV